jgi:hypothetical protein
VGDRAVIAERPKDPVDAPCRHGGEEVLQVHLHHYRLADVQIGVGSGRAAGREAMGGFVRRDLIKYLVQEPALNLLQAELWASITRGRAPARGSAR